MALLARWFRFQPNAIDDLDVEDFEYWLEQASTQIGQENNE
nr:GpE family phage tail protein [Hafnia alvei]